MTFPNFQLTGNESRRGVRAFDDEENRQSVEWRNGSDGKESSARKVRKRKGP